MGNAFFLWLVTRAITVHPHVHGERTVLNKNFNACAGSSPRTWGTLHSCVLATMRIRFIPTYMGNAL